MHDIMVRIKYESIRIRSACVLCYFVYLMAAPNLFATIYICIEAFVNSLSETKEFDSIKPK